ncbi:MAG: class I SAM-dependent methyltransferase, partial [Desulfovermiculus sp.]|nr:class I SAM-dependent methyltransferase [Desulfovermiculus sp.]
DMLWLTNRGYCCTGLDCSSALAELARRHTGQPVIEADFESFDFQGMDMDALLLVGALVNVPHERFQLILSRILRALKPQGHMLLTMKHGQGSQTRPDGRVFYLWPKAELMPIFEDCGLICVEYFKQQSKIRASDMWMSAVLSELNGVNPGNEEREESLTFPWIARRARSRSTRMIRAGQ